MKVIMPIKVTPEDIVFTTAEDTDPLWSADATYSKSQRVIYDGRDGPSVYQSVADGNAGNKPDVSPDDWVRRGSTARWAPFDDSVSTVALTEGGYLCRFRLSKRFESIALLGLQGAGAIVRVFNARGELAIERQVDLRGNRNTTGWKSYFFGEFSPRRDVTIRNIPPLGRGLLVEVEVTGQGMAGVGEISAGMELDFGCVEHGVTHGTRNWRRIESNLFGDERLVKVGKAKRNSAQIRIPKNKHRAISNQLTEIEDLTAVFIGSEDPDYEPLVVHGYLERWEILIDYPKYSLVSLSINGRK